MSKTLIVFLAISALLWGCASAPTTPRAQVQEPRLEISPDVKAQMERQRTERAKQKQEIFDAFAQKSDEYQNIVGACESLSDKEQNQSIKETCGGILRDLRQELTELKGRLETD